MKVSDKLLAAKKLIEDPKDWTQNAFARDSQGTSVGSYDITAVCYCALGATHKSIMGDSYLADNYLHAAAFPKLASEFNDTHTHSEVLGLFDRAIQLAKVDE